MRIAIATLVLAGCASDDVKLPLAEIGKSRLSVVGNEIAFDPFSFEPCHVLADGAIATLDGVEAQLVQPGGSESDGDYHYDLDEGWTHTTHTSCLSTVWSMPARARGEVSVEIADDSATFRAAWSAYGESLALTLLETAVVEGRRVQTYRVSPATHVFSADTVVANPGPNESWIPDRYAEVSADAETVRITYPRPDDPYADARFGLRVSWRPRVVTCEGFTECIGPHAVETLALD